MSSSGKGQSTAKTAEEVGAAWDYAVANMRGDRPRVIVEEFIEFDSEITLLTVATKDGVLFCAPVGHRQEAGDYRESWQPAAIPLEALQSARFQARKVVEALGGHGIFGVEFFVRGDQAIFSELSPAPARHRHGDADLAIPERVRAAPARGPRPADPVDRADRPVGLGGDPRRPRERRFLLRRALPKRLRSARRGSPVDLRIFAKPKTLKNRRMGVALARGDECRGGGRARQGRSRARPDSLSRLKEEPCAGIADRILAASRRLPAATTSQPQTANQQEIKVAATEQEQLHQLDAFNLAIGLKRAIYDAGYTCKRVTDAGFVGTWQNLDMWMAHCVYDKGPPRDWAVFAGPDGSAQVRDCKDVLRRAGLPDCKIKQRPKGSFTVTK